VLYYIRAVPRDKTIKATSTPCSLYDGQTPTAAHTTQHVLSRHVTHHS